MAEVGGQLMTITGKLRVEPPFDLDVTLDSGQAFRWRRTEDGAWAGILRGALVTLRHTADELHIEASAEPKEGISQCVANYLRMDDDLPAILSVLKSDIHVRAGVHLHPGLRLLRQEPWEVLVGFILSATSNIPRIARTMELLADTLGEPLVFANFAGSDQAKRKAFPKPEAIVRAGEQRLRELRCGFRAPYLIAAAEAVSSGKLALETLRGAPYDETLRTLSSLPGVADKIADCTMLFGLDHLEAFPVDRWIHRAMVDWYGLSESFDYAAARDFATARFGQWAGYANQYLFWSIRQSRRPMIGSGRTKRLTSKEG